MFESLFGRKTEVETTELTEEEKKIIEMASKTAVVPVTTGPRSPVKRPPGPPIAQKNPWTPSKVPAPAAALRNPNDTLVVRAPQPFRKFANPVPAAPKVTTTTKGPSVPSKKQR